MGNRSVSTRSSEMQRPTSSSNDQAASQPIPKAQVEALTKAIQECVMNGGGMPRNLGHFNGTDFILSVHCVNGSQAAPRSLRTAGIGRPETLAEQVERVGFDRIVVDWVYVAGLLKATKSRLLDHLMCLHDRSLKRFLKKQTALNAIEKEFSPGDPPSNKSANPVADHTTDACTDAIDEVDSHSLTLLERNLAKTGKIMKVCMEQEEYLARTYILEAEIWDILNSIEKHEEVLENCVEFEYLGDRKVKFHSTPEQVVDLDLRLFTTECSALMAKVSKELGGQYKL